MAESAGTRTSYTDTTPHKRAIADLIDLIDPSEVPLLKYLGIGEKGQGGSSKVKSFRIVNWPHTKVEWLEDELKTLTTTTSVTLSSDTTAISFAAANRLRKGNVILVNGSGGEYMMVTSVSSNSATVSRNWGGTQATFASGVTIEVVSNAHVEGEDSAASVTMDISAPYNYSQIFEDQVKVSGTQIELQQYGIDNEYDYQTQKVFKEQMRLMEKSLFHGQRQAGAAATSRGFGGLKTFITDNTTGLASAALTQKQLEDSIQAAWTDGGNPDLIICNAWGKRKISSFYTPAVRTTRDETRGGVMIDEVDTEFGTLRVLMDRWCPSTELYIVQTEYVGVIPFPKREFFEEELAKSGDYKLGHILGEYTFVVRCDKAHARIEAMSTSS